MNRDYDEDLFESTKMTFGEHLEVLRQALFKSLIAIVLGFVIGLFFADRVVEFIQTPLLRALDRFVTDREAAQRLEAARQRGGGAEFDEDAWEALVRDDRMVVQQHWIDPVRLFAEIERRYPGLLDTSALPRRAPTQPERKEDLLPIQLYHSLDDDPRIKTVSLAMQESFLVFVKAALLVGAVLASPIVFYYLWQFVAAGLYPHEKHYVHLFLPISSGLFLAGAALAFFVVFNFVLRFLLAFNEWMGIDVMPRITEWLNFVLFLPVGFGISFQLPLIMFFLERIGVFTTADYLSKWRMAVLVIFVISMLLTPADPGSMILMALPLTLLYFGGIAMCRLMPPRRTPYGDPIEA